MFDDIAVIGAGNGGKAAAADLALQGKKVRLFEFPEYNLNLQEIMERRVITATGAVAGEARLSVVTTDLAQALEGADSIMVCTQALAHDRIARELAPLIAPNQLIMLNPGSTGGALRFASIFRDSGIKRLPILVETGTLTYGCRAEGANVNIRVKARRVVYATLPATEMPRVGPLLEACYPGLVRGASVLEAGLNNANPVIHPAIVVLNAARIEREGHRMGFYRDGVSPVVARLISKLDNERMDLLRAFDYPAQPDPVTSVEQGYAASTDYYECYNQGLAFREFASPDTLINRYFHEDIGMGLVMFCSLGELIGTPTPTCEIVARMGAVLAEVDYFAKRLRTVESLGLDGLDREEIKQFVLTGKRP
jgi:opine dehydrogenase